MSDRGQYSPIARVLLDGPDYRGLAPIARHTLLALKIGFGPSGIEVHYPEALTIGLAHRTGWTHPEIESAMSGLCEAGWVQIEENVVWIVGQLEFHPNMTPVLQKHRRGIQNHVAGLPHLAIVRRFIDQYPAYFVDSSDAANGYPVPSDSLSQGARMPSESRIRSTQTQTQHEDPLAAAAGTVTPYTAEFEKAWSAFPKREGSNSKLDAFKMWRARLREGVSADELSAGVERYARYCLAKGIVGTEFVKQAKTFFGKGEHWQVSWEAVSTGNSNGRTPAMAGAARLPRATDQLFED